MTTLSYPLSIHNGKLSIVTDETIRVNNAIKSAILTYREERLMYPEYGLDESIAVLRTFSKISEVLRSVREALEIGLIDYPVKEFSLRARLLDDETGVLITINYVLDDGSDFVTEVNV